MSIVAYQYPVFQPAMRIIASITNAFPAEVTTTFAHNYIPGTIIRLVIPREYIMIQADQLFGLITITGTTTFLIDIDTRLFSPFVVPVTVIQYAQSVAIAEDNSTVYGALQNALPY